MTRLQAFISLAAFLMMATIISLNALYLQKSTTPALPSYSANSGKKMFQANFKLNYAIQRELKARNYFINKVSGHLSIESRAAIMAYQSDHKLPLTANGNDDLLQHILFGGFGTISVSAKQPPSKNALKISVSVQQTLLDLGYSAGPLGALQHPDFSGALKSFEEEWKLPVTGRISGRLIQKLKQVTDYSIKIQ